MLGSPASPASWGSTDAARCMGPSIQATDRGTHEAAAREGPSTPATLEFGEQRGCLSDAWMVRVPPENLLQVNLGHRPSMLAFLARRQTREPDVDVLPLLVVAEKNAPVARGQPVTEELDTAGAEHPPDAADCDGFNRRMRVDDKRRPAAAAFMGRMTPMIRGQDRAGRATVPARVGGAARVALIERAPRPLRRPRLSENGPDRTNALHSNPPLGKRKRCRPPRAAIMCDSLPLEPTRWKRKSGKRGCTHPGSTDGWQAEANPWATVASLGRILRMRAVSVLGGSLLPALLPIRALTIQKGGWPFEPTPCFYW